MIFIIYYLWDDRLLRASPSANKTYSRHSVTAFVDLPTANKLRRIDG